MTTEKSDDQSVAVNMRQGVIWAYRLLLEREPNNEEAITIHLRENYSVGALRQAFRDSQEYRLRYGGLSLPLASAAIISAFEPFCSTPAPPGSWHDFLGVRTRCAFLPDSYVSMSGMVLGPPGSINGPVHEIAEWIGTLRSVIEARGELTVVELGAGWAPWLIASANAAVRKGIDNVRLIGVEGSSGHVAYMRQNFIDNGLNPDAHTLIHGVIGSRDGTAHFPKLLEPNNTYGSQASDIDEGNSDMEAVPCLSLQTLLADVPRVDLLHCDIQGAEATVLQHGRDIMDARVHRIVVGTHARNTEAELLQLFGSMGWMLEDEAVCQLVQMADGAFGLKIDGTQVWRNPRV